MKTSLVVFICFSISRLLAVPEQTMLPSNVFAEAEREWQSAAVYYGDQLRALSEPSILAHAQISKERIYRFTWFRSLQQSYAIFRLQVNADGKGMLILKLAKPMGEARKIQVYKEVSKTLSEVQVADLTKDFMTSSYMDLLPFIPRSGCDGSAWLLEFANNGFYHVTFRVNPEEKEIQTIGRRFIEQFADADLQPIH